VKVNWYVDPDASEPERNATGALASDAKEIGEGSLFVHITVVPREIVKGDGLKS
jgi:hypothetical protein